jgi:hypothetical protein
MRSIHEIQDEAGWNDNTLLELLLEWVETYCHEDAVARYLAARLKDEQEPPETTKRTRTPRDKCPTILP